MAATWGESFWLCHSVAHPSTSPCQVTRAGGGQRSFYLRPVHRPLRDERRDREISVHPDDPWNVYRKFASTTLVPRQIKTSEFGEIFECLIIFNICTRISGGRHSKICISFFKQRQFCLSGIDHKRERLRDKTLYFVWIFLEDRDLVCFYFFFASDFKTVFAKICFLLVLQ